MASLEYKTTEEFTKKDLWINAAIDFVTMWPAYAGGWALGQGTNFFDELLSARNIAGAICYAGIMTGVKLYKKAHRKNKNAHNQGELTAAEAPKALEPARQYGTIEDVVGKVEEKVLKL